jgi:hypothetical protein
MLKCRRILGLLFGGARKGASVQSDLVSGGSATYTHNLGTRNLGLTGSVRQLDPYGVPTGGSAVLSFGSHDTGITAIMLDDNSIKFTNVSGWDLRLDAVAFRMS